MYLEKLKLHNFRCYEKLEIDFNRQLTVLVGKNGSGKTTVLEAIAIALGTWFVGFNIVNAKGINKRTDPLRKAYQIGATDDVQTQFPVEIEAWGKIEESKDQILHWKRELYTPTGTMTTKDAKEIVEYAAEYQKAISEGRTDIYLPMVAYYGTGRLWDYHRQKRNDVFKVSSRTNGYIDCLDGTANVKLMMDWFQIMTINKYQRQEENLESNPELDTVYLAMEKCLTNLSGYSDVKIRYNMGTQELDVYYSEQDKQRMRIPLNQLSDGYKGMISLVADIAYRMATLNPQLGTEVLSKGDGVVLIDEVDLHLHPAWQQKVIDNLMNIFPKVQFIVSTHAPAIISSVKTDKLRILSNKEVCMTANQVYGKDVNSVMKEIMGVNDRPDQFVELFEKFYRLLSEKKYDDAGAVLDKLDEERGYHDPEIAKCRVKLKLERMRGK
jgi:predicted ATP-binding protein involved in virulence